MKKIFTLQIISRFIFLAISVILVVYIVLSNIAPFGITTTYSISELGPKDRVGIVKIQGQEVRKQTNDLIYFTTKMPFKFDTAKVKVTFKNLDENQQLFLGYQDQVQWHYENKLIDAPFFDLQFWTKSGSNPTLYQKEQKYNSVQDFLNNPPFGKVIGSFDYDISTFGLSKMKLPDYKPKNTDTVINTPLRGKHILYAYLKNERFKMTLIKQDLNIYEDPDPMTVTIYKDNDVVYKLTASDDGITDASGKVLPAQEIYIENPEEELPEEGVYKIVINASSDVVIKSIKTNFYKIVFEGPIYPVENREVFSKINDKTTPTKLFTNAKSITARTFHNPALQEIKVTTDGSDIVAAPKLTPKVKSKLPVASDLSIKTFKIEKLHEDVTVPLDSPISQLLFPKSDVVINGYLGYFAFDLEQLFYPSAYSVLPITKKEDIEKVDYILSDYSSPRNDGKWKVVEVEFDLSSAVIKNGKLSWLIKAPGLKENQRTILIKDIEIEFKKRPLDIKFLRIWK